MLEHVMCWEELRGWRWIGIEEASRKYPYSVSRDQGYFRCAVCGQYVAFAKPKEYARYFTHASGSNDCPDKQSETKFEKYRFERNNFRLDNRTLPLRLVLDHENQTFNFEIGLAPLPEELFRQACETQTKINIHYTLEGTDQKNTYLLASRLYELGTTYFSINDVAAQYRLELSSALDELANYWAKSTPDLSRGALFDASSRKIVPPQGEIVVGRSYYFLSDRQISPYWEVDVQELPYSPLLRHSTFSKNIHCYRLEIKRFNQHTWDYAEILGFRLTQSAPTMFPVWPPYVANSSLIFYENYKFQGLHYNWIFVKGDFGFKAFPIGQTGWKIYSGTGTEPQFDDKTTDSYLVRVDFGGRGICGTSANTIATGRDDDIVKSYSFWKTDLTSIRRRRLPSVTITSGKIPLEENVYYASIPENIVVEVEYNGVLDIIEQDRVIECKKLSPDVPLTIKPKYGQKIVVWQGRDIVREISFLAERPLTSKQKNFEDDLPDDHILASRLMLIHGNEITTPWTLRLLLPEIKNHPLVTRWVLEALHKGRAPQNAIFLLRQTFQM